MTFFIITQTSPLEVLNEADFILIAWLISCLFAFLPATLTGIIVAMTETKLKGTTDYIKLGVIGCLVSLVLEFLLLKLLLNMDGSDFYILYPSSIAVGTFSSILVGYITVPKQESISFT